MNEEDCIPYEFYWVDVGLGDLEVAQFFGASWRLCGTDDIYTYTKLKRRPRLRTQFNKIISHIERPTNVKSH